MTKKSSANSSEPEVLKKEVASQKKKKDEVIEIGGNDPVSADIALLKETLPAIKPFTALKVQDPLTLYLKEISRYKLLTPEEEQELTAELLRTGDIDIAKKLVLHGVSECL
jgi:RNA polymerase sigma-32 factor